MPSPMHRSATPPPDLALRSLPIGRQPGLRRIGERTRQPGALIVLADETGNLHLDVAVRSYRSAITKGCYPGGDSPSGSSGSRTRPSTGLSNSSASASM